MLLSHTTGAEGSRQFPVKNGSRSGGAKVKNNAARRQKTEPYKLGSNRMIKKHKSKLILKMNISKLLYLVQVLTLV